MTDDVAVTPKQNIRLGLSVRYKSRRAKWHRVPGPRTREREEDLLPHTVITW
jgi:hypothetical protein